MTSPQLKINLPLKFAKLKKSRQMCSASQDTALPGHATFGRSLNPVLPGHVTFGRSLNLAEPHFPLLFHGDEWVGPTYHIGLLWIPPLPSCRKKFCIGANLLFNSSFKGHMIHFVPQIWYNSEK